MGRPKKPVLAKAPNAGAAFDIIEAGIAVIVAEIAKKPRRPRRATARKRQANAA